MMIREGLAYHTYAAGFRGTREYSMSTVRAFTTLDAMTAVIGNLKN